MEKKIVDSLKRKFKNIEKYRNTSSFYKAIQEYFSLITKNSITLNYTRLIITDKNKRIPDEFWNTIFILLIQKNDYSLIPSNLKRERLIILLKQIALLSKSNLNITEKNNKISIDSILFKTKNESMFLDISKLNNGLIGELNKYNNKKEVEHDYSTEKNILTKKKRKTTLPQFPRTDWVKVSIKFIDDSNVLLSNSIETKPITPESIGCIDERTQKQDKTWKFFIDIARGNGTTKPSTKKEREKIKKQKQKITDILRKIFQNDTDPFEVEKGGIYRAKFIIEYIENINPSMQTKKEFLDINEIYGEMTEE